MSEERCEVCRRLRDATQPDPCPRTVCDYEDAHLYCYHIGYAIACKERDEAKMDADNVAQASMDGMRALESAIAAALSRAAELENALGRLLVAVEDATRDLGEAIDTEQWDDPSEFVDAVVQPRLALVAAHGTAYPALAPAEEEKS